MTTDYGKVVGAYSAYKNEHKGAEWLLGHQQVLGEICPLWGKWVLDFGCGPASFSAELSRVGARLVGMDVNEVVIEEARKRDPKSQYYVYRGSIGDLVGNQQFDYIVATFSFCVISDQELRGILAEMRTLLVPGGKLIVLDPNQEKAHGIQYSQLHYHLKEDGVKSGDLVHVTLGTGELAVELYDDIYRTHADYYRLLSEAGFEDVVLTEPVPYEEAWWEGDWEMERKYPPFILITAK